MFDLKRFVLYKSWLFYLRIFNYPVNLRFVNYAPKDSKKSKSLCMWS